MPARSSPVEYGIYFGTEEIHVTEIRKKKATLSIAVPHLKIIRSELEQKFPDETRVVPNLKDEFKKNNISFSQANVALAGENLIIRTFDLPIFLSRKELNYEVIAFEAKKYIPFKIDELTFDFRFLPDFKNKKILVLFVGIKKEILDKYLLILKELDIQAKIIEYSAFGILRLLNLAGIKQSGLLGILNVDIEEETNFVVCQNGFPLFCRDLILIPRSETGITEEGVASRKTITLSSTAKLIFIEKLRSELRISLDFFRRKFPTKPLNKIIILTAARFQAEISSLIKDLGLSSINLDISKFIDKNLAFSCPLAKSLAVGLGTKIKPKFTTNLIKPAVKKQPVAAGIFQALPVAITAVRINFMVVAFSLLIVVSTLCWGWYRRIPLIKEIRAIKEKQPFVEGILPDESLQALSDLESDLSKKIQTMESLTKDRFYLTRIMNIIPEVLPEGAWLTSVSFQPQEDKFLLTLEGFVYLGNAQEELAAVNDFAFRLNNNPEFSKRFKKAEIVSLERIASGELETSKFVILCR